MINLVTKNITTLATLIASVVGFTALCVFCIVYGVICSSIGLYITALMFAGFAGMHAIILRSRVLYNNRVLSRTKHIEIIYSPAYRKCPPGLREFVNAFPIENIMCSITYAMHALTEGKELSYEFEITKNFNSTNIFVIFYPFASLQQQDKHGPQNVGGLQVGDRVLVFWKESDVSFVTKILMHELGHMLIGLNYPKMTEEKHHEILAMCNL